VKAAALCHLEAAAIAQSRRADSGTGLMRADECLVAKAPHSRHWPLGGYTEPHRLGCAGGSAPNQDQVSRSNLTSDLVHVPGILACPEARR
jgi:hypothetical protein